MGKSCAPRIKRGSTRRSTADWPDAPPKQYYQLEYMTNRGQHGSSTFSSQDEAHDAYSNIAMRLGMSWAELYYIVPEVSKELTDSF